MNGKQFLENYDPVIKEVGYENYSYTPAQVIERLDEYKKKLLHDIVSDKPTGKHVHFLCMDEDRLEFLHGFLNECLNKALIGRQRMKGLIDSNKIAVFVSVFMDLKFGKRSIDYHNKSSKLQDNNVENKRIIEAQSNIISDLRVELLNEKRLRKHEGKSNHVHVNYSQHVDDTKDRFNHVINTINRQRMRESESSVKGIVLKLLPYAIAAMLGGVASCIVVLMFINQF